MKYFARHFLMVILIAAGGGVAAKAQTNQPDSLSVQQAIALALNNQPALDEVEAEVAAADARVNQAKSDEYPQVDVEGSYQYVNPVSEFSLQPDEPALAIEPHHRLDAHVAAHQLIYDFGQTKANIALARSKTLTAKQQIQVKKWTISYFTVQTYYSVLYLQQQIKVEEQQINTLKEDLNLAQKRFDNGSATKYDVLSLKVRIAEENNTRLDLISQEKKMKIRLRKLFGWQSYRRVALSGSLHLATQEPVVTPGDVTYSQRPDYKILQNRQQVAQQLYRVKGMGDKPVIEAGGTAGFKNGYIKNLNKLFGNYSVGVNVRVPLFNGFQTHYEKQEARAQIHSLKAQTMQLQRSIDSEVQQAYVDVETGLKKLQTTDLQIEQAQEQLRLAKLRYRKGVVTNTDLLTSETALARARLEKVTAQYHILLNQYELKKAAGKNIWSQAQH